MSSSKFLYGAPRWRTTIWRETTNLRMLSRATCRPSSPESLGSGKSWAIDGCCGSGAGRSFARWQKSRVSSCNPKIAFAWYPQRESIIQALIPRMDLSILSRACRHSSWMAAMSWCQWCESRARRNKMESVLVLKRLIVN